MPLMSRYNVNDTEEVVYLRNWKPEHLRGAVSYIKRRFWVGWLLLGGLGTVTYVLNLIGAVQTGQTLQGVVALCVWLAATLAGGVLVTFLWYQYRDRKYRKLSAQVKDYQENRETIWNNIDEMAAEHEKTAPPEKKKKNYDVYTSYPRS